MDLVESPNTYDDSVPGATEGTSQKDFYARLDSTPISEEAKGFVRTLRHAIETQEMASGRRTYRRGVEMGARFEACLGAFLADLLRASADRRAEGWVFRSLAEKSFYLGPVSYSDFRPMLDVMERLGFIECRKAPRGRRGSVSKFDGPKVFVPSETPGPASTFRASRSLMERLASVGIVPENQGEHFLSASPDALIVLRADKIEGEKKGKILDYRHNKALTHLRPKASDLEHQVQVLNDFISRFDIRGGTHTGWWRCFNLGDNPDFNWNKGGRLYSGGNYQTLSDTRRLGMTIGGEAVVEIDVHASQLACLHGLVGEDFRVDSDAYVVDGLRQLSISGKDMCRWAVKTYVISILGHGKPLTQWPPDHKASFLEATGGIDLGKHYPPSRILKAIVDRHPLLRQWGGLPYGWGTLQYLESEALITAMLYLMKDHEVPSLPVFDSLLVRKRDVDIASEALKKSYANTCSIEPRLVIKECINHDIP